jgi:Protein of unknown function (DUF2917)
MRTHILQSLPFTTRGRRAPSAGLWKRLWSFLSRRASRSAADRFSMRLAAGQEFRLYDAAGWAIACRSGSVWITQEADTRDVFLNAGESFGLDRGGLALILARQNSALAVRPPVRRRGRLTTPLDAPAAPDGAQEVWLRAVYPECGPWNDPAYFRRSGLL